MILDKIDSMYLYNGQIYLNILYKARVVCGYYGLLRVGELTSGSHPTKACDIQVAKREKKKLQIILRSSKTHTEVDIPQKVTIISNAGESKWRGTVLSKHCPYQIIKIYLAARGNFHKHDEPFFIFRDRSPVKPQQLCNVL